MSKVLSQKTKTKKIDWFIIYLLTQNKKIYLVKYNERVKKYYVTSF
jgi:hypothetical protein